MQLDDRLDLFARVLIWNAKHSHISDRRMLNEPALDLGGVALAFLAEYLDPTLRSRAEVETLGWPVIAEIPRLPSFKAEQAALARFDLAWLGSNEDGGDR